MAKLTLVKIAFGVLILGLVFSVYTDLLISKPIPEPAAMFLFGTGLFGFARLGLKAKKQ